MDIGTLLKGQYEQSHRLIKGIIADVPPELMNSRQGTGTVGSIGSIYAHIVMAEDTIMSKVRGEASTYESGSWAERLGIEMPGVSQTPDWAAAVTVGPADLDAYADTVFAKTEETVGRLSGADLERLVEGVMGQPVPALVFVGQVGVIHVNEHAGEIAALKGIRGLKGLGF